jgi:hypothetical protein
MNPVYLEVAVLAVLALAVLMIAWKLSIAFSALVEPFRNMSQMQGTAIEAQKEIQFKAIEAQKEMSKSLVQPFQLVASMQNDAIEMQGRAIEAQKQAAEAQREAASGLRLVMQRTLELSEQADRSVRKLSAALEIYHGKALELDKSRLAFVSELANLKEATQEVVSSRDQFLKTSSVLARLDSQIGAQHREAIARIDELSSRQAVDRVQKTISEGLRQVLVRDLSRSGTRYPRQIRIDFIGSGIETLGRVDGGEFLASLKKVRFQLVCEAGNCDHKGNAFLSEAVYEVKQPSYFVGTLRKATGSADPALVLFDSINRFDDFFLSAATEGAKVALHVTVRIALAHTAAVTGVVELDGTVSALLEKIKKGVNKPEEVKDLLQVIAKAEFTVRDIGGLGHNQMGNMMERRDDERNQPLFGGLTRILDPGKGYIWVCPAHAQEFTEGLRELARQ